MRLVQTVTHKETGNKVKYTMLQSNEVKTLEQFQEQFIQQGLSNGWQLLQDTIGIETEEYKIQVVVCE